MKIQMRHEMMSRLLQDNPLPFTVYRPSFRRGRYASLKETEVLWNGVEVKYIKHGWWECTGDPNAPPNWENIAA